MSADPIHRPSLWTADRGPLTERYARWRRSPAGQRVYLDAVKRARLLRRAGVPHYGIAAIVEAIRYDVTIELGRDDRGFRINNDHRALLAREIMDAEPDLAGYFTVRERSAL